MCCATTSVADGTGHEDTPATRPLRPTLRYPEGDDPAPPPGVNVSFTIARVRVPLGERMKRATPLCVLAPPSSSEVTFSCVTVFTTLGPVTNIYEVSSTIIIKSVIAGE